MSKRLYSFKGAVHLVSNDNTWVSYMYTKGYGTYNAPRGGLHRGLDLNVKINELNFAIHGGEAAKTPYISVHLKWDGKRIADNSRHKLMFSYLHLSSAVAGNTNTTRVMAGQIIGFGGRTPNDSDFPVNVPGHTHIYFREDGTGDANKRPLSQLRNAYIAETDSNRLCIPYEDLPILFPCACQFKISDQQPADQVAEGCMFEKHIVISRCWAANHELVCPYMFHDEPANPNTTQRAAIQESLRFKRRIQVQLNKLYPSPAVYNFYDNILCEPYQDPPRSGNWVYRVGQRFPDGVWGDIPVFNNGNTTADNNANETSARNAHRLRRAIYQFRLDQHALGVGNVLFYPGDDISRNSKYDARNYNIEYGDTAYRQLLVAAPITRPTLANAN